MGKRPDGTYRRLQRLLVAVGLVALAGSLSMSVAVANPRDVNIGVEVVPTSTTAPPPTTASPTTSRAPATSTTSSPHRVTTSTGLTTTSVGSTTVPVLPPVELPTINVAPTIEPQRETGLVGNFRSGVRVTRDIVKGVASGKPLAEVAEEILPPEIANVVVPAIRTTSTFSFPIGLAIAVIIFLMVQRRIDASDPKLAASRVAHDDDQVKFE